MKLRKQFFGWRKNFGLGYYKKTKTVPIFVLHKLLDFRQ